jgi:glycogen operon protein
MLVAGDELGRTQQGNNNAYCQDNEISWINWKEADTELVAFTQKLIRLRKQHPTFRRRRWFQGQPIKGIGLEDIAWFLPEGIEMPDENWNHDFAKSLGVFLNGKGIRSVGPKGENIVDDNFYVIFNAHYEPLNYILPPKKYGAKWIKILDTSEDCISDDGTIYKAGEPVKVSDRSVMVLKQPLEKRR